MKKLLFLFSFVLVAGMVSAQKCDKSAKKACCASKAKTAAVQTTPGTQVASMVAEAEALAESDETIEKKVCSASGKVSYHQKSVCSKSGKISTNEVMYDSESKVFVNVDTNNMVKSTTAEATGEAVGKAKACSKSAKSCAKTCTKKKAALEQ